MRSQHSGGGEAAAQIGYYRWPTISGDEIFFVCEDDVYAAKIAASSDAPSKPRRVTQAQGACIAPPFHRTALVSLFRAWRMDTWKYTS